MRKGRNTTTNGRKMQNSSVASLEDAFSIRTDANERVPSFDIRFSALMIFILPTFSTSIWRVIFLFTNFCIRSFGIRSFALYDLRLTIFCLRTSGIRSSSLRTFAYDLSAYDLLYHTIIYLRTFAYEHLAYDLFLYELFLTIFCRTIFCPIRSFAYEHLLTNFRHTNNWHTNICPVTARGTCHM